MLRTSQTIPVREVRQDGEGLNSLETPDSTHPLAKLIYFNPILILLGIFTLYWSLESYKCFVFILLKIELQYITLLTLYHNDIMLVNIFHS